MESARRNDLHFCQLGVDIGELCTRLRDTHLGCREVFLLGFR